MPEDKERGQPYLGRRRKHLWSGGRTQQTLYSLRLQEWVGEDEEKRRADKLNLSLKEKVTEKGPAEQCRKNKKERSDLHP